MRIICLDMEGVLIPEIWIKVAHTLGIDALHITTRDISDYDVLMKKRLAILDEHKVLLPDIQHIIKNVEPLDGAVEFITRIRVSHPLAILSDTFTQFIQPLLPRLQFPTILCNSLIVDDDTQRITGYRLRQQDGKRHAIEGFRSMGYKTYAAGDSYNDISMIHTADEGALFCPSENVRAEFPDVPVFFEYKGLGDFLLRN